MPRAFTTAEFDRWTSGKFVTHLDVLIERVSGGVTVMQSYRDFGGVIWIRSARLTPASVDTIIGSGSLTLHRQVGDQSLAPLIKASSLNQDGGVYAPALDFGREIEFRVALTEPGVDPAASDWKVLFQGVTDDPEWPNKVGPVTVPFRDRAGPLSDTYIRSKRTYGSEAGVDAFTVMQQIVDDAMGAGQYVLDDRTSGARFNVTDFPVEGISVWEALEKLALQWGGKRLGQEWNETAGEFRIAVNEPDRNKSLADYTAGPNTYLEIHQISTGGKNLRNIIRGTYLNSSTSKKESVQIPAEADVDTDPSVQKYGPRFFGLTEDASKGIDTATEMTAMVQAIYDDLSVPIIPQEPETKLCWFAQVDDLVTWGANALLYDEAQDAAVLGLTHDFPEPGVGRTRWRVAGKPKGAYRSWLQRAVDIAGLNAIALDDASYTISELDVTSETDTQVTLGWAIGAAVDEVWYAVRTFAMPYTRDYWADVKANVTPLADGVTTLVVAKPAEDHVTLVQVEARRIDPASGELTARVWRKIVYAKDAQAPVIELDDSETATIGTQWLRIQERGIAVTKVEAQTQIGTQAAGAKAAPTRGLGAASTVRGGTLATGEYEQDVTLDQTRFSWITFFLTLETGEMQVVGPFGFDRNKEPDLLQVEVSGKKIKTLADSDGKSLKAYRTDVASTDAAYWEKSVDGKSYTFDVPVPDAERWAVRVCAYSDPVANVTSSTPQDCEDVTVAGPTASTEPVWTVIDAAPPANLDDIMSYTLQADSAPTGYTAEVYERHDTGSGMTGYTKIASLAAPPTTETTYTYDTNWLRNDSGSKLVQYEIKAEILNGSGVVVETQSAQASWYHGTTLG
jgi:hypothetical protein